MKKFFVIIAILFVSSLSAFAETINVVQVTDVNISSLCSDMENARNSQKLKQFVEEMNSYEDIDLIVFTGDNIENSKKEELKLFCKIIKELKIPYYVALGENDVHLVNGMSKSDYMIYLSAKNQNQLTELSNYEAKFNKDFLVIILDGSQPRMKSPRGSYSASTLVWLDKTLRMNCRKKVLIFQHFPINLPNNDYRYSTREPDKYQAVLNKHKNVVLIASGHFDADEVVQDKRGIYHISTPSFDNYPAVFRKIQVNYQKSLKKENTILDVKTETVGF